MDRALTIFRDVACFLLGAWAFVYTVTHGQSLVAMSGSIALLGGPAAVTVWLHARGGSTSEPPSPSPPVPLPAPRSSPSSSAVTADP